jgi:pyruvate kinase
MMNHAPARRAPELAELFARRGAVKAVAEGLGISTAAVSTWRVVPHNRREAVAQILGVPVEAVPVRVHGAKAAHRAARRAVTHRTQGAG